MFFRNGWRVASFGRSISSLRLNALPVRLCGLCVLGEIEIPGVALDRVDQVFELTLTLLRDGSRFFDRKRRGGLQLRFARLEGLPQRLGRPFEMPDRFEIAFVALRGIDELVERILNRARRRLRRFDLGSQVIVRRCNRRFNRLRRPQAEWFGRLGRWRGGCELGEQRCFVVVCLLGSGKGKRILLAVLGCGFAEAFDARSHHIRACALGTGGHGVQLGQQRELHRQQALVGRLDNAERPADVVLRLPGCAQGDAQSPA